MAHAAEPAARLTDREGFATNDPYDRSTPVRYAVGRRMASREYMRSIRAFAVPDDALALWYFGQNGFLLKGARGPLVGIDLYLSDSCAQTFAHLPFRLSRQLPVFVEPEDLDVDVFVATHAHEDHADPETIRRLGKQNTLFVGPYDAQRVFHACGVPGAACRLVHPGEVFPLGEGTTLQATFALPTDATDLNHIGVLLTLANGIRFYNTGDTAWTRGLAALLPQRPDICAICINAGFHNLSVMEAAEIIHALAPRVAVPCHYDMMVNNVAVPSMLQVAMDVVGATAAFHQMRYYEPWLYRRVEPNGQEPQELR